MKYYKVDELKDVFMKHKIGCTEQYIELAGKNDKMVGYRYIRNGFYNDSNNGFNIEELYYIEKKNYRRY
jgi:hypothetical protein